MINQFRLAGFALFISLASTAACRSYDYECADACNKVYDECGTAVEVQGVDLQREQCELICEEGLATPQGAATLWLDCVEDSVCPGQVADEEDEDLHRYDVEWCNPQFEILIQAG